jgi:polyisoprenyl-teichoic acid--peptidoglycan teichoic acid transferase
VARRRARGRRSWPQRLLITFNIGLIVTSLVVAGGLGYLNYKLDQVPRIDLTSTIDSEPQDPGDAQNYLMVGTDSAERLDPDDPVTNGRENLGTLSDTIMLLRVDPGSTQAQLLSFPRDLFVTIPGAGEQRINSALSAGGPETLIQTIQDNFDVPVHHYVEVDFEGFEQLVEAVDGVPMYFDKPLRDPTTGLLVPHAGCVSLDPTQALAYARSRSLQYYEDGGWHVDGTGDLGRISRQQEFIRRAMQRAIEKGIRNPITLNSLVDVGIGNVTVDTELSADDIFALGRRFRSFNPESLQTMSLDVYDDVVNGQQILRLQDTEANQRRIDIFKGVGGQGSDQATSVRVAVNNGTGTTGQATEVAEGFASLGFDTSPGTGDAERFDFSRTVVRYTAGNEAVARFVAAQLEAGADLEEVGESYVADVIVVTGSDYAGVKGELQPPPEPLGGGDSGETPADAATTTTQLQYGEVPPPPPSGQTC